MPLEFLLRAMRPADLPAVMAVQRECYAPEFLESLESFASKLRQTESVQTCWVASSREGALLGYVFSLPVSEGSMPALNAPNYTLPPEPEFLYLHDLAIAPAGRGHGLARFLVDKVQERAEVLGLSRVGLIAVQDSQGFWRGQGFAPRPRLPEWLQTKLRSFGDCARYLESDRAGVPLRVA